MKRLRETLVYTVIFVLVIKIVSPAELKNFLEVLLGLDMRKLATSAFFVIGTYHVLKFEHHVLDKTARDLNRVPVPRKLLLTIVVIIVWVTLWSLYQLLH